jgi:hypothetical protein
MIPALDITVNARLARKKRAGRCFTPHCRRRARQGRNFCCTCQDKKWRERHPMRYLWKNLKSHAKARSKAFTITFEQWEAFCLRTRYHELVGNDAEGMTVDRDNPNRGYHADNIVMRTRSENCRRQFVPYFKSQYPVPAFQPPEPVAPGEPAY